jgi:hypothetical protein
VWIHPRPTGGRGRGPRGAHDRGQYITRMSMWKGCRKQGGRLGKGPRKDMCSLYVCSLIDASRNVQGREEVCSRNVSAGVDRKANSRPVRATGGLLQGLQRRVALEALRESSCSFWTDLVAPQTASTGVEAGVKKCQRALTGKQTLSSGRRT